jgi:hypothetical protein
MIVAATRGDLRDELSMADEAFALSPISARATQPSEADYDAIREAFMETSRGRWFLSEYAKRNRNADTRMVLDAVTRMEQNLASQKMPAPEISLAEALAVVRDAVDAARIAAVEALDGLAVEQSLAPIRKGAQVIRETLLRLREIGADGRIYDLMESQVGAIEAGCGQLAGSDAKAALSVAFDLIDERINRFASDDAALSSIRETTPPVSATVDEAAAATTASASEIASEAAMEVAAAPRSEDIVAPAQADIGMIDAEAALDDALDMIALEMAAPDLAEDDVDEIGAATPDSIEPVIPAQAEQPAGVPKLVPITQPSLGASLIANGIVRPPDTSAGDPLAPIRRMSQAEKIAFFS